MSSYIIDGSECSQIGKKYILKGPTQFENLKYRYDSLQSMAINFIRNIAEKKVDPFTHHEFVRYSIGSFVKEPFTVKVGKMIKIQAGFEYVNTLIRFVASLSSATFEINGAIPTAKDIGTILTQAG